MKLTSPSDLRALLRERGLRPSRARGQNFLIDENVLRIIVEAADLHSGDRVLEIGPGPGVLTEALLPRVDRVVAVEKDRGLFALLRERLGERPNLELVEADALGWDLETCLSAGFNKVVSNLPYSVGTRVLVRIVTAAAPPARIVVTLQRDVAERIIAAPGQKAYGLLAIWVGRRYRAEVPRRISRTCFYPAPEVSSSLVVLTRLAEARGAAVAPSHFQALTRWAFTQRRKQLQGLLHRLPRNLGAAPADPSAWLAARGVAPEARPEDLDVEAWCRLSRDLAPPPEPAGKGTRA